MMKHFNKYVIGCCLLMVAVLLYGWRFYPRQVISPSEVQLVNVRTPNAEIYHHDCLHPCVRSVESTNIDYAYWMVQSPYYQWDSKVENPILYRANIIDSIGLNGTIVADTPDKGFNSDPCLFIEDSVVYVFWREFGTPLCRDNGCSPITVGVNTQDGIHFSSKQLFLKNVWKDGDTEQSPILLKRDSLYYFYSVWYEYAPERKNRGIAIWTGTSLSNPDFVLSDTIPLDAVWTCDKKAEIRIAGHRFYLPWPKKYDMWHFDLLEYDGLLWMVSSAEKDDNIMISVSEDWKHFRTLRTPLINNHYMQNYVGYRQYYYKPSAIVENDTLYLFWTTNAQEDFGQNILFSAKLDMVELLKKLKQIFN